MIKAILIDLSGVYFSEGTELGVDKIQNIIDAPKEKIEEIFFPYPRKEGFLYRKGKLTEQEFWKRAMEKLNISEDIALKLKETWLSSYVPNPGMKELVLELRKKYKVILFSGSTKGRIDYLDKKYNLRQDFDKCILSYEVGLHKLEKEFYEAALELIGYNPEECLYIDDRQKCLDFAKPLGFHTILFENIDKLEGDLGKLGIAIK